LWSGFGVGDGGAGELLETGLDSVTSRVNASEIDVDRGWSGAASDEGAELLEEDGGLVALVVVVVVVLLAVRMLGVGGG